jgi:hypothetical protein
MYVTVTAETAAPVANPETPAPTTRLEKHQSKTALMKEGVVTLTPTLKQIVTALWTAATEDEGRLRTSPSQYISHTWDPSTSIIPLPL